MADYQLHVADLAVGDGDKTAKIESDRKRERKEEDLGMAIG